MPAVTEAAKGKGCVGSVRESQGRRARRGAGCTGRTGTVRYAEGLMVEAGVTDSVDVAAVVASWRCASHC